MTGYEALYLRLESTLEELDSAMGAEGREREVELVLAAIGELRAGMAPVLDDRESEITFFCKIGRGFTANSFIMFWWMPSK